MSVIVEPVRACRSRDRRPRGDVRQGRHMDERQSRVDVIGVAPPDSPKSSGASVSYSLRVGKILGARHQIRANPQAPLSDGG